jgi:hypothetical protein
MSNSVTDGRADCSGEPAVLSAAMSVAGPRRERAMNSGEYMPRMPLGAVSKLRQVVDVDCLS